MHLVIGGSHQGKTEYACRTYGIQTEEIFYLNPWVLSCVEKEAQPEILIDEALLAYPAELLSVLRKAVEERV